VGFSSYKALSERENGVFLQKIRLDGAGKKIITESKDNSRAEELTYNIRTISLETILQICSSENTGLELGQ